MGDRVIKYRSIYMFILGSLISIIMFSTSALAGDIGTDVEKILGEIRQDQPLPSLPYLKKAEPMNIDCVYYRGDYQGIRISVETHPNSQRVAAILLEIPGSDRTAQVLPAVKRVLGPPRSSDPGRSEYGWEWPRYRTASLHYAKGTRPGEGLTVISLFYR